MKGQDTEWEKISKLYKENTQIKKKILSKNQTVQSVTELINEDTILKR